MTSVKAFPALTEKEVLDFLKTQRPGIPEETWRKCDPVYILQWILPAYAQKVYIDSQEKR